MGVIRECGGKMHMSESKVYLDDENGLQVY